MIYKTYPCGCQAGPDEQLPDCCPVHPPKKLPTEDQIEAEIKAQAHMVARLREADRARQEQNLHDNMLSLDGPI